MSKIGYGTYIRHRLSGFEGEEPRLRCAGRHRVVPHYKEHLARQGFGPMYFRPVCRAR